MARVSLRGVRKLYENGQAAVSGVDLDVADGEFVVLVGPSGCGKTTLLRMIAGLDAPTDGRITIGERVVNDLPPKDRDIAMVFQSYALYPHMSVRENMAFGLSLRKRPKAEIDDRVQKAAAILGIEHLLERSPRQLSGGQRQRVAIGRAIVRQPQVFLFDEPLSNLDAKLRVQMRREISALRRQLGATVIYVTHDQVEAMTMGDRIVILRDGAVQQIGTPTEVYRQPANTFVAGFIGTPPMNLLRGAVAAGGAPAFVLADGGITIPLPPAIAARVRAGDPLTLGVRPDDVRLESDSPAAIATTWTLDLVELLGGEMLVHASHAGVTITAKAPSRPHPQPGTPIQFWIDPAAGYFFDGDGAALA